MNKKEVVIVFFILAAIIFSLTYQSIFAPFSFEDDHLYFKIANTQISYFDKYEKRSDYKNIISFLKYDINGGRLHTSTYALVWLMGKCAQSNPFITQLFVFAFALSSGFLFFILLRLFNL